MKAVCGSSSQSLTQEVTSDMKFRDMLGAISEYASWEASPDSPLSTASWGHVAFSRTGQHYSANDN